MVKKIAALIGAGALALSLVVPALAFDGNVAIIKGNDATATANSGLNTQDNYGDNYVKAGWGTGNTAYVDSSGSRTMDTGKAKAEAKLLVVANSNVGCDCDGDAPGGLAVVKWNDAEASANSGLNAQDNLEGNTVKAKGTGNTAYVDSSGSRTMTTGNAKAKAKVVIVVNSNLSWF